jgi:lysophospholipase L1-like esterase
VADAAAVSRPSAYEEQYRTSVFLGDSITEGLSYHDVLNEVNVLAGAGKTAEFALKDVAELVRRKPARLFIQLGSDDILWPTDDPKKYSLTHYAQLIDSIQTKLPKAKLTLLSVTPVTADTEQAEPRYRNIADYNEGLRELAARKQVGYVDLTPLAAEHSELYDKDGIHFQAAFYPHLLDYLKDH